MSNRRRVKEEEEEEREGGGRWKDNDMFRGAVWAVGGYYRLPNN